MVRRDLCRLNMVVGMGDALRFGFGQESRVLVDRLSAVSGRRATDADYRLFEGSRLLAVVQGWWPWSGSVGSHTHTSKRTSIIRLDSCSGDQPHSGTMTSRNHRSAADSSFSSRAMGCMMSRTFRSCTSVKACCISAPVKAPSGRSLNSMARRISSAITSYTRVGMSIRRCTSPRCCRRRCSVPPATPTWARERGMRKAQLLLLLLPLAAKLTETVFLWSEASSNGQHS